MKRFMKNLCLALALTIALTLVSGCNSSTPPSGSQEPGGSASPSPSSQIEVSKFTIKVYGYPGDRDAWVGTELDLYLQERFGVALSYIPQRSEDVTQEFMQDSLANELADVIISYVSPISGYSNAVLGADILNKAAREGLLAEVSTLLKDNAPLVDGQIRAGNLPPILKNFVFNPDFGDKLYFLPKSYTNQPSIQGWGLYIRGDVADALDIGTPDRDLIRTTDDLFNLLVRVKEGGFKDTNGNDVYALGHIQTWPQIMTVMTRPFDFGGVGKTGFIDGELKLHIQTDYAWDQILWVRKLLDAGLLDPETLTQTYQLGSEKMSTGKYAITAMYNWQSLARDPYCQAMTSSNPEMLWRPLGNMESWEGDQHVVLSSAQATGTVVAFSAKAKNLDKFMTFINWSSSKEGTATMHLGLQSEGHWFWNDEGFAEPDHELYFNVYQDTDLKQEFINRVGSFMAADFATFGGAEDMANCPYSDDPTNAKRWDPYCQMLKLDDALATHTRLMQENAMAVYGSDYQVDNRLDLSTYFLSQYKGNENIIDLLQNEQSQVLNQCYLAKTEEQARGLLNDFLTTLEKYGVQDYLDWLTGLYNEDPDMYTTYITDVQ